MAETKPTINEAQDARIAALENSIAELQKAVTGYAEVAAQVASLASAEALRSDTGGNLTDDEAAHIRFVLSKYHAHERA